MNTDKIYRTLNSNRFAAGKFHDLLSTETIPAQENSNLVVEFTHKLTKVWEQTLLNAVSITKTPLLGKFVSNQFPVPTKRHQKLDNFTSSTDASEKLSAQGEPMDFSAELLTLKRFSSAPEDKAELTTLRRSNSDPLTNKLAGLKVPRPLALNIDGCKCGKILYVLNHFIMNMRDKWDAETSGTFSSEIQKLLDYLSINAANFKTARADSLAVCFILLVGSKLQISKKDFVGTLKMQKLAMVENIAKVK